mmetsp:Transcript_13448/g.54301  ORF Transcript_13448/g.54301 Transcript_13448/m.54301 type:complete len:459 (+) Transcript_13448:2338-3714(+)
MAAPVIENDGGTLLNMLKNRAVLAIISLTATVVFILTILITRNDQTWPASLTLDGQDTPGEHACEAKQNLQRRRQVDRTSCVLSGVTQKEDTPFIFTTFQRSGRYEEMLEIWIDSVHHFRIPYLVVGIEEDSCVGLEANCVTASWLGVNAKSISHLSTLVRGYVVNLKWLLLLDFLEHGFDVIYSDLDVLFKQNPLVKPLPWRHGDEHYDVLTQTDWVRVDLLDRCPHLAATSSEIKETVVFQQAQFVCGMTPPDFSREGGAFAWYAARPSCSNTGLMYWRASHRSRMFLWTFVAYQLGDHPELLKQTFLTGDWEQSVFNYMLHMFIGESPQVSGFDSLRYKPLSLAQHVNSLTVCGDKEFLTSCLNGTDLVSLHAKLSDLKDFLSTEALRSLLGIPKKMGSTAPTKEMENFCSSETPSTAYLNKSHLMKEWLTTNDVKRRHSRSSDNGEPCFENKGV